MPDLVVSPLAKRDLIEIGVYIAEQSGSKERAEHFIDSIYETLNLLATQPEMGQLRTEFATGLYKSFTVGNYVIYFRPIPNGINISRILHGARDHDALL